jgi:hypothetical protein
VDNVVAELPPEASVLLHKRLEWIVVPIKLKEVFNFINQTSWKRLTFIEFGEESNPFCQFLVVLFGVTWNQNLHERSHYVGENRYSTYHDQADEYLFKGALWQKVTIPDGGKGSERVVPHLHHHRLRVKLCVFGTGEFIVWPEIEYLPALEDVKNPRISPVFYVETENVEHDTCEIAAAENDDDEGKDFIGFDNIQS